MRGENALTHCERQLDYVVAREKIKIERERIGWCVSSSSGLRRKANLFRHSSQRRTVRTKGERMWWCLFVPDQAGWSDDVRAEQQKGKQQSTVTDCYRGAVWWCETPHTYTQIVCGKSWHKFVWLVMPVSPHHDDKLNLCALRRELKWFIFIAWNIIILSICW